MNTTKKELMILAAKRNALRNMGRRRSNFDRPNVLINPGMNVVESGFIDPYNNERKLHRNSVKLTITNPDTDPLDAVISAGLHIGEYTNRILTDGTNTYGDAADVVVNCQFGINDTGSLEKFKRMILEKGVIISQTRYRYTSEAQLGNKINFRQYDEFGDHKYDYLDPEVDYDPRQFNDKVITLPVGYVLNRDTTMSLRIEGQETVIFTFWIDSILNLDQVLNEKARKSGGNVLVA
ncbi:MAG: hypothetical protein AAFR66_18925 [Bacteroidota bacterium]